MQPRQFVLFLLIMLTCLSSYTAPSFSSSYGSSPNAVKISDPCPAAWQQLPEKIKKKFTVSGISFNAKQAFMTKCNQYRDQLIAQAKKPISDLQTQLQQSKDKLSNEAKNTFLSWLAEKFKEQILPTLPADIQQKYDPNSPLIQAKAQQWLNQPGQEVSTYVNEYIKEKAPLIASMLSAYTDLTTGESAQILTGLKAILTKAQGRLSQLIAAKKEIEANPDVPYTKILEKYGFSGAWLDKFKHYEGKINALNAATNAKVIVFTTIEAFQTDDPKVKIEKMFDVMDAMSDAASRSKVPIVSLVGDIVNGMVKIAKKMLSEVRSLGEILKKRAGYCVGTGAPGDDPRSIILDKRGILACPLAHDTLPWKHIYETVEPSQGLLLFWTGSQFIDGEQSGGGKAGLQQTLQLISAARELGYPIKSTNITTIANVYNTPGGIGTLMKQANRVISTIAKQAKRIKSVMGTKGKCAKDTIIQHIESVTGLQLKQFLTEFEQHGQQRLVITYAASYVAKTGGFGFSGDKRSQAYDTYTRLWNELKNLQIIIVDGTVKKQTAPSQSCTECAEAIINAKVLGGTEVKSCEVWQADNKGNFVMHVISQNPQVTINLSALTQIGNSDVRNLSLKSGNHFVTLLINDKPSDKACESAQELLRTSQSMLAAGNPDEARNFLNQAKAKDCDKLKPEIERIEQEMSQSQSGQDTFDTSIQSCEPSEIQSALDNNQFSSSQKQRLQQLLINLKEVNNIINPSISSDSELNSAIDNHHRLLSALDNCPIASKIKISLQRLTQFKQQLTSARLAKTSCKIESIQQAINSLLPFNQPLGDELLTQLQQRVSEIQSIDALYNMAKSQFKQGQNDAALAKLQQAKTKSQQLSCPIKKIDQAINTVNQAISAANNPQAALSSCNLTIISTTLAALKQDPANQELVNQLRKIQQGIILFRQALPDYRSGKIDRAALKLNRAKGQLGQYCPKIQQRIQRGLGKITRLRQVRARIETAIANCHEQLLQKAKNRLSQKINPYLKVLLPRVEQAIKSCRQVNAQKECVNQHGPHVQAHSSQGNFSCVCKQGYSLNPTNNRCTIIKPPSISDGNPKCRKQYGIGAYASAINPDGTYFCHCRSGFKWQQKAPQGCVRQTVDSGHSQCKKEYGKAAYAVKLNSNGTYNCQCRRGYRFNNSQTRCIRHSVRNGHSTCRKQYGRGAYAVRANRDGSYHCQCRSRYTWNSSRSHCRRLTSRDGHRACKRHFGRSSYATSYAGRGRWNCYTPQRRPQARCPGGYYLDRQEGCIKTRRSNPLVCPRGYHRKAGGACHRS